MNSRNEDQEMAVFRAARTFCNQHVSCLPRGMEIEGLKALPPRGMSKNNDLRCGGHKSYRPHQKHEI